MTVEDHKHTLRLVLHVDSCHAFVNSYKCECGATATANVERDPEFDPYSFEFLDENCDRCAQLAGGAKPFSSVVVHRADGTVELEQR